MSGFIVIRDYKFNDFPSASELLRNAYLSNVSSSWWNAIMKEITFQLVVLLSGVLFIFVGVPALYCVISIPLVLLIIYVCIYSSNLLKATELMYCKVLHCWVAEYYEPLLYLNKPKELTYEVIAEDQIGSHGYEMKNYKRTVVGTVAVNSHNHDGNTAWLFRLAVLPRYQRQGFAYELVKVVKEWCIMKNFTSIEVAVSECQEWSRDLFAKHGFEIKQIYHKQLVGSAVTLMMSHFVYDLIHRKIDL